MKHAIGCYAASVVLAGAFAQAGLYFMSWAYIVLAASAVVYMIFHTEVPL